MTGLPFDGTFSTEAVAAAGHALVEQLFDEAMATIAELAENWDAPVTEDEVAEDDEPVAFVEPATWSITDDDDEDDVRSLGSVELPVLLPRPRPGETLAA